MFHRALSGYFEDLGSTTRTFQDKLIDGSRTFVCGLWQAYPDQLTQNKLPQTSFARGYMNNLCSGTGLLPPQPPPPPFTGGQCCATKYRVNVSLNIKRCFENTVISPATSGVDVTGKINGIVLRQCIGNRNMTCVDILYSSCSGENLSATAWSTTRKFSSTACSTVASNNPLAEYVDGVNSQFAITTISVISGLNNCGDPPRPNYPVTIPPPLPEQNLPLPTEDGDTLTFNFKLPKIAFPPVVLINNSIELEFNLDGINFNFNYSGSNLPDGQPNPVPPPKDSPPPLRFPRPRPGGGGGSGGGGEYDINETPPPPPEIIQQEEQEKVVGNGLEYVIFEVTSYPKNNKKANSSPGNPLLFCGWMQFTLDGYNFPRTNIEWERSIFKAPENATGYRYCLYIGIKARIVYYQLKAKK